MINSINIDLELHAFHNSSLEQSDWTICLFVKAVQIMFVNIILLVFFFILSDWSLWAE